MKIITMKHKLLYLLLLLVSTSGIAQNGTSDFNLIMERIRQTEWKMINDVSALDIEVDWLLNTIQTSGKWNDIDYSSTAQTGWEPLTHLTRMKKLVLAYTLNTSAYYGSADIFTAITNGFNFWHGSDPRSTNWYVQQIACPQQIGIMLILMRGGTQQLATNIENKLIARMEAIGGRPDQGGSQGTGANKIDIATHWVYRGCLKEDVAVLSFGIEQVYYPVFVTTGEGLQSDYSYFQHGQQFFNGGYAISFVKGVARIANFTAGTQYQLPAEKLELLTTFTRIGYLNLIRGKHYLYNVIGRGLSRPGALNASSAVNMTDLTSNLDTPHSSEYEAAIKRLSGEKPASYGMATGQKHFWRGDYSLCYSPAYSFDVRMASTRTYRNENGNGENLKGYFLSEGAHTITVDGDEYLDIFPVWNWTRIPGITAPQKTSIPKPAQWGTYGTSNFAGGVSNGSQGISVFSLNNSEYGINTVAKKAWFMFGDEIICLGAGITSTATEEINTTANQCLLNGDIVASSNRAEIILTTGTHTLTDADWIYHDKVGYFFPKKDNVYLTNENRTGNWNAINSTYSTSETKDVFTLWFNHGTKPTAAKYAYIIVPGKTLDETRQYSTDNIKILINSDSVQVVQNLSQNMWGFVFYKAATFTNGNFTLKAGNPCVMMLENPETASVNGWLADPSQIKRRLNLRFVSNVLGNEKELIAELPKTPYAGSTVELVIDSNTSNYDPTQSTLQKIYPADDAYVRDGGYGSTNYGSEDLIVKLDNADGYRRQFFLKFDLENLEPDTIEHAELVLTVASSNTNIAATQWELYYVANDNWTESTLVWNNKPTASTLLGTFPGSPAGTEAIYDLKQTIADELLENGDTKLSINVVSTQRADGKTDAAFFSKENGDEDTRPHILVKKRRTAATYESPLASSSISMLTNPVKRGEKAVLMYNAAIPKSLTVNVYDSYGRTILQYKMMPTNANNRIILETAQLNTGLYLVAINGNTVKMLVK